jgi:hypothetical protein
MSNFVSDLSQDFIINKGDRPDGMRGPSAPSMWGDVDIEPSPVGFGRGYVERDIEAHPVGSLFGGSGNDQYSKMIDLIPWEEMQDRIEEKTRTKTRMSDIRMIGNNGEPMPSLDQNGQGYCWFYDLTRLIEMKRALMGLPYIRLSGHSGAYVLKDGRDEGGWIGLATTFAMFKEGQKCGVVPAKYWPEKAMNRKYDTPENWEIAKNFCVTEGFIDLQQPVYGKTLTFQQVLTLLLSDIPVGGDFNWWSHSVALLDVEIATLKYPMNDPRRYAIRIQNSWRDSWGVLGTGVILGDKVVPDGAVGVRNVPYCEEV